jgi:hypothetical protein
MVSSDMTPHPDWKALVIEHARRAGASLSPATIDELAAHLDDLYLATRADGASPDVARRRAMRALEESALGSLPAPADRRLSTPALRTTGPARPDPGVSLCSTTCAWRSASSGTTCVRALTVIVLGLGRRGRRRYTIVDGVVLAAAVHRARSARRALGHQLRAGPQAGAPLAGQFHGRARAHGTHQDAAAWWRPDVNLTDDNLEPVGSRRLKSANLFQLLGVSPQVGPGFPKDGPFYDRPLICVISDRLWRSRYNADPGLVGKPIKLNDTPYTVAGVMPPRFSFPGDVDIWERLQWDLTQHSRGAHFMEAIARLAPGVDLAQANRDTNALAARLATEFPQTNRAWRNNWRCSKTSSASTGPRSSCCSARCRS